MKSSSFSLLEASDERSGPQLGRNLLFLLQAPDGFYIPTLAGHYNPNWAIAFYEGTVKHIFFVAETKGTMESLQLRPIEQAKISCAKKLFNELSTSNVK